MARCTAMQVCTSFRAAGSARADAWRECDFGSQPREQLRGENVARVLRRAGRQLAVLNVSGRRLTCAALQPLRDCSGLERLSLTDCSRVDAHALGRDVLPLGEGYLASLSVDGIDSLDEESVGRLQSLVRSRQLDVTECDVCKQFMVCKACAVDCGVQICSGDALDMPTCDACKRFWCHGCEATRNLTHCDGSCRRFLCDDCMFTDGSFVCDGCYMVVCVECTLGNDRCMPNRDVCGIRKCEACAGGAYMPTCDACGSFTCEDCADGARMRTCDGCDIFKCGDCTGGAYMVTCDCCARYMCEDCASTGNGLMTMCDDCCVSTCDNCMHDAETCIHTCDFCAVSKFKTCAVKGGGVMVTCDDCDTTTCNTCSKGSDHSTCCGAKTATSLGA